MAPASSPEHFRADHPVNFRAPPPSPVHSGRRSSFANAEVLSDFLEHSARVPDLILPDRIFPRQQAIEGPPVIDLGSGDVAIPGAAAEMGCFQVANHGIPAELVRAARVAAAAGVFSVPPDRRAVVTRSPEVRFGFEEVSESGESTEEFVWSVDEAFKLVMEGIWPLDYSNFCKEMEVLLTKIEKVGEKVLSMFVKNPSNRKSIKANGSNGLSDWQGHKYQTGTICCLYKNGKSAFGKDHENAETLRHDVIRMLIRRNDHSHALCLHLCGDSSEFHVYSKKGWVSFCPQNDALIITIGDQIQAWSGGQYKHVIGRPILKEEKEDCISMAFLYSPPSINIATSKSMSHMIGSEKTISFNQQVKLAIVLTLVYQILAYIYKYF